MNAAPAFLDWLKSCAVELQQKSGAGYAAIDLAVQSHDGVARAVWTVYTELTGHTREHASPEGAFAEALAAMENPERLRAQAEAFEREAAKLRGMAGKAGGK